MTQELRRLAEEEHEAMFYDRVSSGSKKYAELTNPAAILSLLDRLEKAEKEPEITPAMIEAAESVEDLYRRGTPHTWGQVFRAMWRAQEASK